MKSAHCAAILDGALPRLGRNWEDQVTEHILVADDDPKQAALVRLYLERDGFDVAVVTNGREALQATARRRPALIVLDVMMPEVDGLEVCRQLGGDVGIPIILLTARSTENDILLGLYLGADDYLTKPYSPRELVARVRTVLRRTRSPAPDGNAVIEIGPLRIDRERHEVQLAGVPVELTPVEFDLLAALAERPGRVLSRPQLLEHSHGQAGYLTERTVDSHLMNLRRKIEVDPRRPNLVLTVYGVGYKLAEPAPRPAEDHVTR
jgi:DNA-binding response OmpR family regulator